MYSGKIKREKVFFNLPSAYVFHNLTSYYYDKILVIPVFVVTYFESYILHILNLILKAGN